MLKSSMIRKGPLIFCILALIPFLSVADVPTVAVMDFVNNTGSEGLAYLSNSLPEALSASLANMEEIRVVERVQLDRVLEEIELQGRCSAARLLFGRPRRGNSLIKSGGN
jgi:curli biogenesis system outer membrane secretion channel CsgG